jgi:hypothetical protein
MELPFSTLKLEWRNFSVKMSEDQRQMTMKKGLCGLLVATQLMGAWFAFAQTDTRPAPKRQSSIIQANTTPVTAVGTGRTNPAIGVSPRNLDFASVAVGETSSLTLTVRNVGADVITGEAKVSTPFSILGGSPYVLRNSQSLAITVQYAPKATGMNIAVVRLTGGGGASVTVAGAAVPAPPAAPAPPQNLRLVAGR